jgi:hypothetical protein
MFFYDADLVYDKCADETKDYYFKGTRIVRYGMNGYFKYGDFNQHLKYPNDNLETT